jgi:hypothetical protein
MTAVESSRFIRYYLSDIRLRRELAFFLRRSQNRGICTLSLLLAHLSQIARVCKMLRFALKRPLLSGGTREYSHVSIPASPLWLVVCGTYEVDWYVRSLPAASPRHPDIRRKGPRQMRLRGRRAARENVIGPRKTAHVPSRDVPVRRSVSRR